MTLSFNDRVVIVTGAGRGIGRATALSMASRGASVVIADLSADHCEEVVKEIEAAGGKAISAVESVAEWESAGRIIEAAVSRFGRLDALINNAGYLALKPIYELEPEEFEAQVRAHLFGTFYCTRHAVTHMMKQKYGRIVNVVSRAGLVGAANSSGYAAGKGGIFGFTNSIARDLIDTGINVNSFNPAATATRLVFDGQTAEATERLKTIAQSPEHVAAVATFLASEACDFSGQTFYAGPGVFGPFPELEANRKAYTQGVWTPEGIAGITPQFAFPKLVKSLYLSKKSDED